VLDANDLAWIAKRVAQWVQPMHLQPADVEDAQQSVAQEVVRALEGFDLGRIVGPADRAWYAFLGLVVRRALRAFLRARRRLARHYDARVDVDRLLAGEAADCWGARPLVSSDENPALAAELHEEDERLDAAMQALASEDRSLLEQWLEKGSVKEITRQLDLDPHVVRRRLQTIFKKLKAVLEPSPE
jgi:RNA polymerase sigma factor (sigma-70 family)